MSTQRMQTNVKLGKLFYKYTEEKKQKQDKTEEKKQKQDKKEESPVTKKKEEYESYPPYNFSWLVEKKIAGMGWPQTVENLNYISDSGINHLITLSPERVPPILECKQKLKWTEIPIKEFGAPSLKQILKFIGICERAELRGEVVGVHCRQGRGRTGTMLACYLVHFKNMTPERAILTVRVQRPGSCETYEQEKIVCHYHDCERGTIEKPDYRLVEDKTYFDYAIRYMYEDYEEKIKEDQEKEEKEKEEKEKEKEVDEDQKREDQKKRVQDALDSVKSKAMVINHKIYF